MLGLICNALIRPVDQKWFMSETEVAALQKNGSETTRSGSQGIGTGGLDAFAALAWAAVSIPVLWGIWRVLKQAVVLFG